MGCVGDKRMGLDRQMCKQLSEFRQRVNQTPHVEPTYDETFPWLPAVPWVQA